ncbi:MAG: DNA polymerase III subunit chi [Burkholderiales bacterium]
MTEISFYFNAPDKLAVARRLAQKACDSGKRLLIYSRDAQTLKNLDALLWTTPSTGFLPHCQAGAAHADETPVLLSADPEAEPHHEILMNLDEERPPLFSRFDRLLEIVARDDMDDRARARERARFYRDRGYRIDNIDLAART